MNCESLKRAIDAYIEKSDNKLKDTLDSVGFADAEGTVEEVETLEENLARTLKRENERILEAMESADNLEGFINDVWPELKETDDAGEALSRAFFEEFTAAMPGLVTNYILMVDPKITVDAYTMRTTAWVREWSQRLGELMKLDTHTGIENILVNSLETGQSVAECTQAILESGIRDEYYRARRAAMTEMLTAHSVAQQEAFTQCPAVEHKEWRHTGSYRNQPRQNHVDMDGKIVPVDEPFKLTDKDGGEHSPMYPRDVDLPPGERINCHCIVQPIVSEDILGLSIEERRELQAQAIADDDGEWEKELDAKNRAKAGIDENIYKPDEMKYTERQDMIHQDILDNYNLAVNTDRQNRHIEGANGYKEGRSILTANPQTLINKYAGKSQAITPKGEWNNRERFEHTKVIGIYKAPGGRYETPTKYGIIHYSKENGAHIVPAKPPDFIIPKK